MTERTKCMRELYEMLMEELSGAESYSRLACEHKVKNPDMAKKFDSIAADELKHAGMLETEIMAIANVQVSKEDAMICFAMMCSVFRCFLFTFCPHHIVEVDIAKLFHF